MRTLWFILWICVILAGAVVTAVVPDQFAYITGFAAGTFSFMFLRLFCDFTRK